MYCKFDVKFFSLLFILFFQILIVIFYLAFSSGWNDAGEKLPTPIKFVRFDQYNRVDLDKYKSYYNSEVDEEIYLKTDNVNDYYTLINDTLCFLPGIYVKYMKTNAHDLGSKCECLPGYHGNDCSLPEVIWRAFIALRQNTIITKRNKSARRIIYMIHIAHPAQIQQVIITMNELIDIIDLYIVSETNQTENGDSKQFYFKEKLNKGLLKDIHHKILYVPTYKNKSHLNSIYRDVSDITYEKIKQILKNLYHDDLIVDFNYNIIPNPKAILFFKLYDGFSLPIQFRLKWNVYGYFYQHPNKTQSQVNVYNLDMFENRHTYKASLTIGDLNHYGGWFCDLCYNPNDLLNVIQNFNYENILKDNSNTIDVTYIEDLIGDGYYLDGKTTLKMTSSKDSDFCPNIILNNTWKYDAYIVNFYNKIYN